MEIDSLKGKKDSKEHTCLGLSTRFTDSTSLQACPSST